jgi:hypothetical protein
MPTTPHIRSIYRRLWRAAHYAVQNRAPQKLILREKLRFAFRTETQIPTPLEIDRTEQFLRTAGRRRGVENGVVRTLCHIHWSRKQLFGFVDRMLIRSNLIETPIISEFYTQYERCVDMLNKTAGTCLR